MAWQCTCAARAGLGISPLRHADPVKTRHAHQGFTQLTRMPSRGPHSHARFLVSWSMAAAHRRCIMHQV